MRSPARLKQYIEVYILPQSQKQCTAWKSQITAELKWGDGGRGGWWKEGWNYSRVGRVNKLTRVLVGAAST